MSTQLVDRRGPCRFARLVSRTEHGPRPKDQPRNEIQIHRRRFSGTIQDISSTVRPGLLHDPESANEATRAMVGGS
ncbi:hypothetical protein PoB_007551600 [Plakobranchus ocellatus]|uniref:Uncharacterized protein n=1 Tax=Plakobranchus ocellatus TaxID=259542 RepID=A0AAV4DY39_9GAST|nr:hypothetical protein PoB_007551600 [Plakobranchus ocellatus]